MFDPNKTYTLEEQQANRKLWIAALRSGEIKQTQGLLENSLGSMCCLGVLCKVADVPRFVKDSLIYYGIKDPDNFFAYQYSSGVAPKLAMDFVGLTSKSGYSSKNNDSLTEMNDRGLTFEEIANYIESNPPGLFKETVDETV